MGSETRQIKLIFAGILMFIFSGFASCTEIEYMIWAESAEARIISVKKVVVSEGRRGTRNVLSVKYEWSQKDGVKRNDKITKGLDWTPPATETIQIDNMPGVKGSRLAGKVNYFALIFFFGSGAAVILILILTARKAYK